MAIPVLQVTASVILALFLLRLVQRLLANSTNSVAQGIEGGLAFIIG